MPWQPALSGWIRLSRCAANIGDGRGCLSFGGALAPLGICARCYHLGQPPLFAILVSWALRLGGDSLLSGRLLIVAFSLAALLALTLLPQAWDAPFAVPFVLFLTATDPLFLRYSRRVMGEVPCLAFLLASLVMLVQYRQDKPQEMVACIGALFALAVAIKPIAVGYGVTFVFVLATQALRSRPNTVFSKRHRAADVAWFALSALLVLIPTLELYNPGVFLRDVVGFHLAEVAVHEFGTKANIFGFIVVLQRNELLAALTLPGVFAAAAGNLRWTVAVGAGIVATLGVLFLLPSFQHHYTLLMPLFALFAGIGLWEGIELVVRARSRLEGKASRPARFQSSRGTWNSLYLGLLAVCGLFAATN